MTAWARWLAWTMGAGALVLGGVTYVNSTAPGPDVPNPIDLTTVAEEGPDRQSTTPPAAENVDLEPPVAVEPDDEQVVPSSSDMPTTSPPSTADADDDDDRDDDRDDDDDD